MPNVACTARQESRSADVNAPRRVLFVCTGNTCRSPMAAALLAHTARQKGRHGSLVAASAGLFAADGALISQNAATVLAEAGVPSMLFEGHAARTVTDEMMANADVVIGITGRHAMELMLRFPLHAAKIEALPIDIADPFGGDTDEYRACLSMLSYAIAMRFFAGEGEYEDPKS